MRPSNKSRSRNKNNNNRRNVGNIVNRVFDSAGPEGKVRGTPAQVIEKYLNLARDAQLSGDWIASENFLQHSEHYNRMLNEAQRAQNERMQAERAQHEAAQNMQPKPESNGVANASIPETPMTTYGDRARGGNDGLVETPESVNRQKPAPGRPRAPRRPRPPKPEPVADRADDLPQPKAAAAPDPSSAE